MTAMETLDGVRLAVLSNRFEAIVRAMMNTLFRTSRSGVLNTGRDFSCAIVTSDSESVAAAEAIPLHVLAGADMMAQAMKEFHPKVRRGDAFLNNSPYHGSIHAADHACLVPVIDESGTHHFTVIAKAHIADCGNSKPTTVFRSARDIYEEGALFFPCVKIQENYEHCWDIIRMCELRIRVPEQWWGDHLALIGAARIGERHLLELGQEVGWHTLHDYAREWFEYSEGRMSEAIRELPPGRVTVHTAHDPFQEMPDGIPVHVSVEVKSAEGFIEVDLRDNMDCQPCGLNMSEATARNSALIGVFNSLRREVPPNAGSFRRVKVYLRENCIVGIPRHPASCSIVGLADRTINAIQRGLAELADGIGMAEGGLIMSPAVAIISGVDRRTGEKPFVDHVFLSAFTGGPGCPQADGWLTFGAPVTAGMTARDSVEVDELRHPIRIHAQYIIPDSEGAGRFRGAPGAYCEYGPLDTSLQVWYASDGNINPALGARGGSAGARACHYKRNRAGELLELKGEGVMLGPGETVVSMSCGGGGYGPSLDRSPARVVRDVSEGWITRERAEKVYGVILTSAGELNPQATQRLRRRLRREGLKGPESTNEAPGVTS